MDLAPQIELEIVAEDPTGLNLAAAAEWCRRHPCSPLPTPRRKLCRLPKDTVLQWRSPCGNLIRHLQFAEPVRVSQLAPLLEAAVGGMLSVSGVTGADGKSVLSIDDKALAERKRTDHVRLVLCGELDCTADLLRHAIRGHVDLTLMHPGAVRQVDRYDVSLPPRAADVDAVWADLQAARAGQSTTLAWTTVFPQRHVRVMGWLVGKPPASIVRYVMSL
jgi:hypothetical protein